MKMKDDRIENGEEQLFLILRCEKYEAQGIYGHFYY